MVKMSEKKNTINLDIDLWQPFGKWPQFLSIPVITP